MCIVESLEGVRIRVDHRGGTTTPPLCGHWSLATIIFLGVKRPALGRGCGGDSAPHLVI